MDEIFGFKFQLSYVDMPQDFFLEIPPCAQHVIFITKFVLLIKSSPCYEVNSFNRKWQAHGRISKIFFLHHFSPSFLGQKCIPF
jgi:hypothetical protein